MGAIQQRRGGKSCSADLPASASNSLQNRAILGIWGMVRWRRGWVIALGVWWCHLGPSPMLPEPIVSLLRLNQELHGPRLRGVTCLCLIALEQLHLATDFRILGWGQTTHFKLDWMALNPQKLTALLSLKSTGRKQSRQVQNLKVLIVIQTWS